MPNIGYGGGLYGRQTYGDARYIFVDFVATGASTLNVQARANAPAIRATGALTITPNAAFFLLWEPNAITPETWTGKFASAEAWTDASVTAETWSDL